MHPVWQATAVCMLLFVIALRELLAGPVNLIHRSDRAHEGNITLIIFRQFYYQDVYRPADAP